MLDANTTAIITAACQNPASIPAALDSVSSYNYVPTHWITILFLVLFGITTIFHLGEAIRFRLWFLIPTVVLCGALELIGWGGRFWSSVNHIDCTHPELSTVNIANGNPFLMQIVTTIIAPTPLLGGVFIIFGRIIEVLGPRYSRLSSRLYSRIFLSCDIIALVIQGTGGGIASSAADDDIALQNTGSNVMLGGIIFQLVVIVLYCLLATEVIVRYVKDWPLRRTSDIHQPRAKTVPRMKLLLLGIYLITIFLFIRSVYRTIELADGWHGKVIATEWLFNTWDGAMIVLAMYTLNVLHPGFLLLPEQQRLAALGESEMTLYENAVRFKA